MPSRLFYTDAYHAVERRVAELLNRHEQFLSPSTASSPRAVGDAIENILGEAFGELLGDLCRTYSAGFARRAMADLAFEDVDGFYYVVDVKTHRTDTRFNMPNLTSVQRLARLYEDDNNYFALLLVRYHVEATRAVVTDVHFVPIEFLDWECLTIGALDWGQLQIADANRLAIRPRYSRKAWMLELCDALFDFYPREIAKIQERIAFFERVQAAWRAKPDRWQGKAP